MSAAQPARGVAADLAAWVHDAGRAVGESRREERAAVRAPRACARALSLSRESCCATVVWDYISPWPVYADKLLQPDLVGRS